MKASNIILAGLLVLTLGCQSAQKIKPGPQSNFMGLWNTYAHCQTVTDLDQLTQDASILKAAAYSPARDGFIVPLPGKIERMVTVPSTRFAVDIKAMAAACSLRAGQTAVTLQKFDVARPILEGILQYYSQSEYAYYSEQAKSMLSALDAAQVQVSLSIP